MALALNLVDFFDKEESSHSLSLEEMSWREMGSFRRNVLETEIKGSVAKGGG